MKFTKSDLVSAIDSALERDVTARAECAKVETKLLSEHRAQWSRTQLPQWKAYRDALTKALKTGVIEADDLPASPKTFEDRPYALRRDIDDAVARYRRICIDRAEFEALRAALVALQGEEVTDAQLRTMGFGASAVAAVFRGSVSKAA